LLRLRKQEQLVGCVTLGKLDDNLLVSQLGYAKRMPVSKLRRLIAVILAPGAVLYYQVRRLGWYGTIPAAAEVVFVTPAGGAFTSRFSDFIRKMERANPSSLKPNEKLSPLASTSN